MVVTDDRGMGQRNLLAWGLHVGVHPVIKRTLGVVRSLRIVLLRSGVSGDVRNARLYRGFLAMLILMIVLVGLIAATKNGKFREIDPGRFLRQLGRRVPSAGSKPLKVERDHDDAWWAERDPPPDPSVEEVGICYFVQIDGKSIPLLERLFAKLWHPRNTYVLHVDWKVPDQQYAYIRTIVDHNEEYQRNFHFVEREAVTYKGVSMVLNTIAAMTMAVNVSSDWEYFVNLSGADYPLVSPTTLRKLLARPKVSTGRLNYVTLFPQKEWKPYSFRIRGQQWDPAAVGAKEPTARTRRMKNFKKWPLEPYRNFVYCKAEAWSIFSRRFVQFVIRSTFAKRMLLAHAHVLSTPEHYFIDILYNHPFWRQTIVPDAFRKVVWWHAGKRSGQHPYVLDKGKQIFSYWLYLRETRSVFARKFSLPDSPLMERIDNELSGNVHGVESSEETHRERRLRAQMFYRRLSAHFDALTKDVLEFQGTKLPKHAYPEVVV